MPWMGVPTRSRSRAGCPGRNEVRSTALNTIANNLANMNTNGFKAQTTNFGDLFYQQVGTTGSGDRIQVGTGVQVAANSTDFSEGSISSTDVSTDAAVNGAGFFVLDGGGGSQLYTQNGGSASPWYRPPPRWRPPTVWRSWAIRPPTAR